MKRSRLAYESLAILVVIAMSALIQFPPAASSQQSPQLCSDAQSTPVVPDTGWGLINSSYGPPYYDYSVRHLDMSVTEFNENYAMWVRIITNVNNDGIYRGASADGIRWSIGPTPVLRPGLPGSWDNSTVFSPSVIWNGSKYLMYYVGDGTNHFREIGVALSTDGLQWAKYSGNPIIVHGPGDYDSRYTRAPSVILDGGTYKMWYLGTSNPTATTGIVSTIDYATSPDGLHWTKYPGNPVFNGFSEFNTTFVYWPSVAKVNGTYLMSFDDGSGNIGYATSMNGLRWNFSNQTQILLRTGGWHDAYDSGASILVDGSKILLWYVGYGLSTNSSLPHFQGVGFATCGVLLVPEPVTTTTTVLATKTAVLLQSVTSVVTTTATTVETLNLNAPVVERIGAAAVGAAVALALSIALIWRRVKTQGQ